MYLMLPCICGLRVIELEKLKFPVSYKDTILQSPAYGEKTLWLNECVPIEITSLYKKKKNIMNPNVIFIWIKWNRS